MSPALTIWVQSDQNHYKTVLPSPNQSSTSVQQVTIVSTAAERSSRINTAALPLFSPWPRSSTKAISVQKPSLKGVQISHCFQNSLEMGHHHLVDHDHLAPKMVDSDLGQLAASVLCLGRVS